MIAFSPLFFFLLSVAVVAKRFLEFVSQVSIDDSLRAKVKKPTVPLGGPACSQGSSG